MGTARRSLPWMAGSTQIVDLDRWDGLWDGGDPGASFEADVVLCAPVDPVATIGSLTAFGAVLKRCSCAGCWPGGRRRAAAAFSSWDRPWSHRFWPLIGDAGD
jgi:hypothetical protein